LNRQLAVSSAGCCFALTSESIKKKRSPAVLLLWLPKVGMYLFLWKRRMELGITFTVKAWIKNMLYEQLI
jgi:hypothetical protein